MLPSRDELERDMMDFFRRSVAARTTTPRERMPVEVSTTVLRGDAAKSVDIPGMIDIGANSNTNSNAPAP